MPEIKANEARIIAYGVPSDTPEGQRLQEIASAYGITVSEIEAKDFNQKLGFMAGLEGYDEVPEPYTGEAPPHSIIWFVSVPRETLSQILRSYSLTPGLKPIDLKSVITEHNVGWTLAEHYLELRQEHRVMRAFTFLSQSRGALEALDKNSYTDESYQALSDAVSEGLQYVEAIQKGIEVSPDEIEAKARAIKAAYQALVPNV